MNVPIRSFKDPVTGQKTHSVNLHYGFNVTSKDPNRRQRREYLQKRNKNPFFNIHKGSKYVQVITIYNKDVTNEMPEIRVINHNPLWKKLKEIQ